MTRLAALSLLACGLCGCVNVYRHVDRAPDGSEQQFRGIADYLHDGQALHVFQIHGMGDHSFGNDCAPGSENLILQGEVAARLGYEADPSYEPHERPIPIEATAKAGTYSVSHFVDPAGKGGDLYFSCVTWGETGRVIKRGMLELDDDFLERNQSESHRALINREAKRFVNRSFSDPVLYIGPMGSYIRRVVWKGLGLSLQEHARLAATAKDAGAVLTAQGVQAFLAQAPVAIISDSLGSRIVFDALCTEGGAMCGNNAHPNIGEISGARLQAPEHLDAFNTLLTHKLEASVGSVYMFANQLPLLELGYMEPPTHGTSLEDLVANTATCYRPFPLRWAGRSDASGKRWDNVQVVAFTDANDALSYHLSDAFKRRCSHIENVVGGVDAKQVALTVEIVNVTLPNPKFRWLFVYSNLVQAHSSGFKKNPQAIDYLVRGNH